MFSEIVPYDKFQNLQKELLPLRCGILEVQSFVDDSTQPEYEIFLGYLCKVSIHLLEL